MRLLKGFFLILFLTACNSRGQNAAVTKLEEQSCERLSVPNEWVVKYRNEKRPRLLLADRTQIVHGVGHGRIEWIEKNYRFAQPKPTPAPLALARTEEELLFQNQYLKAIGAYYAWKHRLYGDNIVVAVVDSGVDIHHPRLKDAIEVNEAELALGTNGLDDDGNGFIDDFYGWNFSTNSNAIVDETGHGTHIAGIIAADHSIDVARGIAPHAKILPVDFVKTEKGDEFSALEAVQYAVDRKVQIINNSWSSVCSVFLKNAFERWQKENIIFVSSAGNDGRSLLQYPLAPANLDLSNHVTVGSFGTDFHRSSFSNTGPTVLVLAPGEAILGLDPSNAPDGLISRSGTSMAAAFVSGALAIGWSTHPELTAQELVKIFKEVHQNKKPGEDPRLLDIRGFVSALDAKAAEGRDHSLHTASE